MFFAIHFLFYSFFSAWKEDRYMLNILPFYYCIASFGIFDAVSLLFKKIGENYKKIIAAIIVLIIIIPNIQTGNSSILFKAESYKQVKDMAELAKNIIPLDSKIITNAPPQVSYYGEREILGLPAKINDLYDLLNRENNTDTIILSVFEGVPEYVQDFNSENFTILNAGFLENQSVVFLIQYNRN